MNTDNYAVIMAGGVGSRFWPLSKTSLPKQFLDLLGTGQTLIQKTYERLTQIIPEDNIFILTNTLYKELVRSQLPNISNTQILIEPDKRNTAPCILLSALKINKMNPGASMIVAPSDHWIEDEAAFAKDVKTAFKACQKDHLLMTLGIQPDFPHTGYGYINYGENEKSSVKPVKRFTEKPDYNTAKSFLKSGHYLWNAGIFIWRIPSILKAFEEYLPHMYQLFSKGTPALNTPEEEAFIRENYPKVETISIDYGIMEKADHVAVLPAAFDWNDLGSWGSLYEKFQKDDQDNVIVNSHAYLEESSGNIIRSPKNKVIAIKGLTDYIVVENDEILLIHPKSDEQGIKTTRKNVQEKFGKDLG